MEHRLLYGITALFACVVLTRVVNEPRVRG